MSNNAQNTDLLVRDYKNLFSDWGETLNSEVAIILSLWRPSEILFDEHTIFDCTAGIGTQSLGLARNGFKVVAADLSEKAILELQMCAKNEGIEIESFVHDVRSCPLATSTMDLVISMGNSILLLDTFHSFETAIYEISRVCCNEGRIIIGIRDHAYLERQCGIDTFADERNFLKLSHPSKVERISRYDNKWKLEILIESQNMSQSLSMIEFELLDLPTDIYLSQASKAGLVLNETKLSDTGFRYDCFSIA